ncbi:MAG: glycosyltransferase family 9 protein [Ignavibacteriae bacterium]|nr:glycosyltransferase family 9 protein [Ignavibacteriota bacterium]
MKILINALSGNGDALMFSPALKLLREKLPGVQIDMLAMYKSVKEMYSRSPYLDEIFFIDFLRQSKIKSLKEIRAIRKMKYDVSINTYPANRNEYNILNFLLGAKKRMAHHYIHTNYFRLEFLNTDLAEEVKNKHNVLQNIEGVKKIIKIAEDEKIGNMEIALNHEDEKAAKEWIEEINPDKKLVVGFHAGSALLKNHINKRWDKNKYSELGKKLMEEKNALILLFGNEFELNNEINEMMGGRGVIASTKNFMDSMARQKFCDLFVSNDTAFLHSAAAFGIPTVGIFGYTNHKELYPWNCSHIIVRKELECSPCFFNSPKPATCIYSGEDEFKCMKTIGVEEVFAACEKLLTEK